MKFHILHCNFTQWTWLIWYCHRHNNTVLKAFLLINVRYRVHMAYILIFYCSIITMKVENMWSSMLIGVCWTLWNVQIAYGYQTDVNVLTKKEEKTQISKKFGTTNFDKMLRNIFDRLFIFLCLMSLKSEYQGKPTDLRLVTDKLIT